MRSPHRLTSSRRSSQRWRRRPEIRGGVALELIELTFACNKPDPGNGTGTIYYIALDDAGSMALATATMDASDLTISCVKNSIIMANVYNGSAKASDGITVLSRMSTYFSLYASQAGTVTI